MNGRTDGRMNARQEPMRPTAPMRPVLQGWLDRHEPAPSGDLLFQVMREVETVEQKGSTRAWLSWFADSPAAGWMMATAAVAVLAIAVVVFVNNPLGTTPPAGTGATPTPTSAATVEPTQQPTPYYYPSPLALTTEGLVDRLFADWSVGDFQDAMRIYTTNADFRWADNQASWTQEASGETELMAAFAESAAGGLQFTRAGEIVRQGDWIAVPMTYRLADFQGDAVAVIKVMNGFVYHHLMIGGDRFALSTSTAAPAAAVAVIDGHLAAINAHDAAATAAYFTTMGQLRAYPGVTITPDEYDSAALIGAWAEQGAESDFHLTRTGPVVAQGTFVIYPWIMENNTPGMQMDGISVVQLDTSGNAIVYEWSIGG